MENAAQCMRVIRWKAKKRSQMAHVEHTRATYKTRRRQASIITALAALLFFYMHELGKAVKTFLYHKIAAVCVCVCVCVCV